MILIAVAALCAAVIFTACNREDSSNVNQDTIWAWYRIEYDANSDITYARATFRFSNFSGTKLELAENASITFNGEPLVWQNAIAYYEKEYAGLVQSGTFVYTDNDGSVFSNSVLMPGEIGFPADLDSLSIGSAFNLNWTGDALQDGERVDLTLSGDNTTGILQFFTTTGEGETGIVLGANQLGNLGTGITTMFMDKVYTEADMQTTSAGGLLEARYKAVNKEDVVVYD